MILLGTGFVYFNTDDDADVDESDFPDGCTRCNADEPAYALKFDLSNGTEWLAYCEACKRWAMSEFDPETVAEL